MILPIFNKKYFKKKIEICVWKKIIKHIMSSTNALRRLFSGESTEETITLDERITLERILEGLNRANFPFDTHFVEFQFDNFYYVLSGDSFTQIMAEVRSDEVHTPFISGSDEDFFNMVEDNDFSSQVTIRIRPISNQGLNGAYFPYFCKMDFDFTEYGIYKTLPEEYTDFCLLIALRKAGIEETKLDFLKDFVNSNKVPTNKLTRIATVLKIQIKLSYFNQTQQYKIFNKNTTLPLVELGLYENHYFLNDSIKITNFAINHYEEVKDLPNWNLISRKDRGYYRRVENSTTKAMVVFRLLLQNKEQLLIKIALNDEIMRTQFYGNNELIRDLEYNEDLCCKDMEYQEKTPDMDNTLLPQIFFDFETITNKKVNIDGKDILMHEPYLCCVKHEASGTERTFKGKMCGKKFLDSLKKDCILLAHNLGYDCKFLLKHVKVLKWIKKGTKVMNVECVYKKGGNYKGKEEKGIRIIMKDTYSMIAKPLRDFGECFALEQAKEVMPYGAYNEDTIGKKTIRIDYAKGFLHSSKERMQFELNLRKWNLITKTGYFNHIKYSEIYCKLDVDVMMNGYKKFGEWMKEVTGLKIINYVSLPSLANTYLLKEGCYDEVKLLAGVPRKFLEKFITGGKTMCAENKMIWVMENKLADFDANSLYPSAMVEMLGFLKGIPKVLKTTDYNIIKKYDGYFVECKIIKINKPRRFPLVSRKDENGTRLFENHIEENVYLDKTSYEDLVDFQDAEIEIIRGYYFDEGRNPRIKEVIRFLYDERKKKKAVKNPIQEIYKLLMNSSYGKTIMKEIADEYIFFMDSSAKDRFVLKNYNWIKNYIQIYDSDKFMVKVIKPVNIHFSRPHVGGEILSMSKRIMNRLMVLCEDNGIDIYYMDTDSTHLKETDLERVKILYRNKYNMELDGKDLGQFSSDFSIKGARDVHSKEAIFLTKKSYNDVLEFTDIESGEVGNSNHTRGKGIPSKSIIYWAEQNETTVMNIYKNLFFGKHIEFDLLTGGNTIKFDMRPDLVVRTQTNFKRTVKFEGEKVLVIGDRTITDKEEIEKFKQKLIRDKIIKN